MGTRLPQNSPVHTGARDPLPIDQQLPLPKWVEMGYRCVMIVFWTALVLFFAMVFYNTLFVTPPSATETPVQYSYPISGD